MALVRQTVNKRCINYLMEKRKPMAISLSMIDRNGKNFAFQNHRNSYVSIYNFK